VALLAHGYAGSKETLFREMVRAGVGAAVASGERFVRDYQGPTAALLAMFIRRFWQAMRDPANARLARLASSELRSFPDLLRTYMDEVVLATRRCISAIVGAAWRAAIPSGLPVLNGRMIQALACMSPSTDLCSASNSDKATDERSLTRYRSDVRRSATPNTTSDRHRV
jgi:AcrR family transcriptional regulator